jgi:hypothetical protein
MLLSDPNLRSEVLEGAAQLPAVAGRVFAGDHIDRSAVTLLLLD